MIRPAKESDIAAILALTQGTGFFKTLEVETLEGVLHDYFDHGHHFQHRAFVWEEDGGVLGYVYHAPEEMTDRTWYVWWIAVAPEQQGRGIGGKLLAFAEEDVRVQDGRLLVVETSTTEHYEPTRRFYLRNDYTAAAEIPDFYADGDGMAVFTKRLAPQGARGEGTGAS